jgi:hypothetical protein
VAGCDGYCYAPLLTRPSAPRWPLHWNQRQADMGRVLPVAVERIVRHHRMRVLAHRLPGIGINIQAGEVAAGNIKPEAVTGLEAIAGGRDSDLNGVDLPRFHECLPFPTVAITHP